MAFANYDRNDTRRPKTLRITPQDVKQAKRGDCGHCVLATAARNQWGWKTYVSATVLWRKVGKKLVRYAIDRVGRKAVKMFDSTDVWLAPKVRLLVPHTSMETSRKLAASKRAAKNPNQLRRYDKPGRTVSPRALAFRELQKTI